VLNIKDIVKELNLELTSTKLNLDREISGGYASDLLSDVIANSKKDNVWITLQMHENIIAVASMKELSGVIIVNGRRPAQEIIAKAEQENITLLLTELSTFEIVGRLYKLGIHGNME